AVIGAHVHRLGIPDVLRRRADDVAQHRRAVPERAAFGLLPGPVALDVVRDVLATEPIDLVGGREVDQRSAGIGPGQHLARFRDARRPLHFAHASGAYIARGQVSGPATGHVAGIE